jgi:hypothetical protein
MLEVIALDLEGTLISNAFSQIARPGLYAFLEGCKMITERVVVFTTVKEELFRKIAQLLASEGSAPDWFATIEYITWSSPTKDLNQIKGASVAACVLVDDCSIYVHEGQAGQWLEIKQFASPYPEEDNELQAILSVLKER